VGLARTRQLREGAELTARHAGHAAVDLRVATTGGQVRDPAPVRPKRAAAKFGRRRVFGIGERGWQHCAQSGQAQPGSQQVVAVAMLGGALFTEHGRFPG
jgi:hypothetical protein